MYPAAEVTALIPGQTRSVTLRGLGSQGHPYPFVVVAGRTPAAPNEAVAGQGLLDATGVRVGEWVRLTVGGTPHILHVVGRSIEPEHGGQVVTTTLDTLRAGGTVNGPPAYAVMLRPGADQDVTARALAEALPDADVRGAPPMVASAVLVSRVLTGLIGVLALIAVVELAGSVSSAVRQHTRELPALRAMGLTPAVDRGGGDALRGDGRGGGGRGDRRGAAGRATADRSGGARERGGGRDSAVASGVVVGGDGGRAGAGRCGAGGGAVRTRET